MKTTCVFKIILFCFLSGHAQNILDNASFETPDGQGGVDRWIKRSTTEQDATVFNTGNHSYKLNADVNQYTFYSMDPSIVEVGREYTLSIWTKTQNYQSNEFAYWRYVNLDINQVQASPIDLNTNSTGNWTFKEWNFYPESDDARLDIFWNSSTGTLWVDDVIMEKKDRVVAQIHTLPEPWRLNIGDDDTGQLLVELQDSEGHRVSNATDLVTFVNLDPDILSLDSATSVNAVYGRASVSFSGTNNPGIGRIEVQSGGLTDIVTISNREKYMPNDFFHIGTMLFSYWDHTMDTEMLADLEDLGMNIVFPINGNSGAITSFMNTIQVNNSPIKVIAQTNLIGSSNEDYFEPTRRWDDAVVKANEYADLFTPFGDILYGYRLSDEPNGPLDHHKVAFHSNALYAADPTRQAITIDAWAYYLTENNMRIRNNDFKLTYIYPFNASTPIGQYPFEYGTVDSETGFDYISNYDDKPWYHMVQSFTMDLTPPIKRWPEAEEMKQQAYSAVSFGAKGIYYFFYHDLVGHPQEIRGMVEGGFPIVHRQLWEPAREINWNLRNNEDVFINGEHSAVSSFATSANPMVRIADFDLMEPNGKHILLVNRDALNITTASIDILASNIEAAENKFSAGGAILNYGSGMLDVEIEPGDAMLIQLQDDVLGISPSQEEAFILYPNPADETLNVRWPVKEDLQLRVYNNIGQQVTSSTYFNANFIHKLDISPYPAGIYYITLRSDTASLTRKFVIE